MWRSSGDADWRVHDHPILGECLPGAFPPSATNRTKFRNLRATICNPWKLLAVDCLGGNGHRIYRDMGWLGGSATGPMLLLLFSELFSKLECFGIPRNVLETSPRPPAPPLGAPRGDADWRYFQGISSVLLQFELHCAMEWPTYELEGLRPRRHLPDDAAFTAAEENPVLVNRWEICCR